METTRCALYRNGPENAENTPYYLEFVGGESSLPKGAKFVRGYDIETSRVGALSRIVNTFKGPQDKFVERITEFIE
jgi:hypothetical protein